MLVFTQIQEDLAAPPSDDKPTVSTEFVPPAHRPSVFSKLSSLVSGMSPSRNSPAPQASDSETTPSTSEPSYSIEVNCIHCCIMFKNCIVHRGSSQLTIKHVYLALYSVQHCTYTVLAFSNCRKKNKINYMKK